MRAKFQFTYGTELSTVVVDALNRAGIEPGVVLDEHGKVPFMQTYEADLREVMAVVPPVVRIEVQGMADARPLMELVDAVRGLNARMLGRPSDPSSYVNNRVEVHVPGAALLAIDEVDVLYDCCTDELARHLGIGWRLVAVCPQPDQRRPDYVIGRRAPVAPEVF